MKSTGTIEAGTGLWYSPNTGATNESGFTAVPAGCRDSYGTFGTVGINGTWWSFSESITNYALSWYLSCDYIAAGSASYYKNYGFSMRCVKDM